MRKRIPKPQIEKRRPKIDNLNVDLAIHHSECKVISWLICGPPKSATTALYDTMIQHPEIGGAIRKELQLLCLKDFQNKNRKEEYESCFHYKNGAKFYGEASPSYIFFGNGVFPYVESTWEDIKYIVPLRDPFERIWSSHNYRKKKQT